MAKVWQPLDPDFVHKLVPEYVEFHKANLVNRPRADQLPWSPSVRDMPAVIGSAAPIPVGSIKDYSLSECKIRVFTPEGVAPSQGWPVFIFFHGGMYSSFDFEALLTLNLGGWTLGDINTENAFSSRLCSGQRILINRDHIMYSDSFITRRKVYCCFS